MRALALLAPLVGAACPDRSPCCPDCASGWYCPGNGGCYTKDQPGCPGNVKCPPGGSPSPPSPRPPSPSPPSPKPPSPSPGPIPHPPEGCGGENPKKPSNPRDLNGVRWPDICIDKTQAHFFGIGDWGGDREDGHTWNNPGKFNQRGGKVDGIDDFAQKYVARQMKAKAADVDPDFVLNAGDNFYPGGIEAGCETTNRAYDPTHQLRGVWESIYDGPGLSGKPWFSVLGNHDYGGRAFGKGWDVQILHTWDSLGWRMPGQFWVQTVKYTDFSIDLFMLDSNFMDAMPAGVAPNHNMCQVRDGGTSACLGIDMSNCVADFIGVWQASLRMLEEGLSKSNATWKIINTHFPGPSITSQAKIQELNKKYGIDLVFTGHTHYQVEGVDHGIPYIISGGGGGVSSDAKPSTSGHDTAYGYVHFTVNKTALRYDMQTWGGFADGNEIVMSSRTIVKDQVPSQLEVVV